MRKFIPILVSIFGFFIYLQLYTAYLEQKLVNLAQENIPTELKVTIISDTIPGSETQKCAVKYGPYKLLATVYSPELLECGDLLDIQNAKIRHLEKNRNFDIHTYEEYLFRQGYNGTITIKNICNIRQTFSLKRYIYRAKLPLIKSIQRTMSAEHAATMCTLLFGTSAAPLDPSQTNAYRQAGVIHLLVVSGSQIAILTVALQTLLRGLSPTAIFSIVSIFNLLFTIMTGAGPSIVRACLMTEISLLAPLVERRPNAYRSLFTASLIMLIVSPLTIFDIGFQLSVLATLALIDVQPRLQSFFSKPTMSNTAFTTSLAPLLLTTPLCVYYFQGLSLAALPLNILILPWLEFVVVSGFAASILGSIFPALGYIANLGNELFLTILDYLIGLASKGYIYIPAFPLITGLSIYAGIYLFLLRRTKAALLTIGLGLGLWWYVWSTHPLTVTILDIGQGDSIYISTPRHRTMLIDCGSELYRAGPIALATIKRETDHLDQLLITHDHTDHQNGLATLSIPIHNIISGNILPRENFILDGISFQLFQDPFPVETNGESIVVLMQYQGMRMLFTGDATLQTEEYLLAQNLGQCDILKVGHHGSRTSSGREFLNRVRPELSVISVGKNNRYGHPHPRTLAALKHLSKVYRTDLDGAVRLRFFPNGKVAISTKT